MKKLLLVSACMLSLAVAGCNKQPETTSAQATSPAAVNAPVSAATPASTGMSSNNLQDIRRDLNTLQTLANAKADTAMDYQDQMMKAVQANQQEQVLAVMKKMQTFMTEFNQQLKQLNLNSEEVDQLRHKFIHSNELGLELTRISTERHPDEARIKTLQQQVMELQKEIMHDVQQLQAKAYPQPAQPAQPAQP